MTRRLVVAATVAGLLLVGCGGNAPTTPAAPATPTTVAATAPDRGVRQCQVAARRSKAGVTPTDVERARGWAEWEASGHEDLRAAGAKLRKAWTSGDLAAAVQANIGAAMACAAHGVEVPFPTTSTAP